VVAQELGYVDKRACMLSWCSLYPGGINGVMGDGSV